MDFFHLVFILILHVWAYLSEVVLENTKKKAISQAVQRVLSHFGHTTAPAKDGIPFLRIDNFSQFLKSDCKSFTFFIIFSKWNELNSCVKKQKKGLTL